eukprot:355494-Chlamydomonas_euryale.AAC.2
MLRIALSTKSIDHKQNVHRKHHNAALKRALKREPAQHLACFASPQVAAGRRMYKTIPMKGTAMRAGME